MLIYDLRYLCTAEHDGDKLNQKPAKIINKDTAVNRPH